MNNIKDIERLQEIFFRAWSIQSSTKWIQENPARGQCGVTALVVNDILGGEILKTETPEGWHFYNRINGKRYDFTESQFEEKPVYLDMPSSRDEAFLDTNMEQYRYLIEKVYELWKEKG
jgi:hypothetical protein